MARTLIARDRSQRIDVLTKTIVTDEDLAGAGGA